MYRAGSYYESGCTGTCLRRKKKRREDARLNEGRCCNRGRLWLVQWLALAFCGLDSFQGTRPSEFPLKVTVHMCRSLIINNLPFVQSFRVSHPIFNRGNLQPINTMRT